MSAISNETLVVIPVLGSAASTPRLTAPILGISSLERTLTSATDDLPGARIVVTSDDADIRAVADAFGGRVSSRVRQAESYTGAIVEVLDEIPAEIVVVLEPTHPFRPSGLIRRTAENLAARDHLDSVVCVRKFTANLWGVERDGEIVALSEGGERRDREYFQEMVGLALASRPNVLRAGRRLGDAVGFEVVDQTWALVDVRDQVGFRVAEALAEKLPQLEDIDA
jgi:CMP-N-acetylneuraminic acid synthetase